MYFYEITQASLLNLKLKELLSGVANISGLSVYCVGYIGGFGREITVDVINGGMTKS